MMKFTDFSLIDPIMSIAIAVFILINSLKNLKEELDLFLEKKPDGIDMDEIKEHLSRIDGVLGVHHIHIRSIDGHLCYATMHVVTNGRPHEIKEKIREELKEHGICHATLELEAEGEHCHEEHCHIEADHSHCHHHHH